MFTFALDSPLIAKLCDWRLDFFFLRLFEIFLSFAYSMTDFRMRSNGLARSFSGFVFFFFGCFPFPFSPEILSVSSPVQTAPSIVWMLLLPMRAEVLSSSGGYTFYMIVEGGFFNFVSAFSLSARDCGMPNPPFPPSLRSPLNFASPRPLGLLQVNGLIDVEASFSSLFTFFSIDDMLSLRVLL